jgi:hypothetical protein
VTLHKCDRTGEHSSKRLMNWRPDKPKFVADLTRGTAGVTTGTVTSTTKENCRELSLSRDRNRHLELSTGLTIGTHIIYQMGLGVEKQGAAPVAPSLVWPRGQRGQLTAHPLALGCPRAGTLS